MNYISIQYLRGLAGILVLLVHLSIQENKIFNNPIIGIFKLGTVGVDIFFIISGFIMMLIINRQKEKKYFLRKRIIRIYPIYWLYLSTIILLIMIEPSLVNSSDTASYFRSIFLFPSNSVPLLNVSWTLVYEVYFYFLISFIMYFVDKQKIYFMVNVFIISSVILGLIINDTRYIFPELKLITSPMLLEFLLGMFIYYLVNKKIYILKYKFYFIIIAIIYFIFYNFNEHLFEDISLLGTNIYDNRILYFGLPAFLLVLGLILYEYSGQLIKNNTFKFIGDISYSLYLSHYFVLVLIAKIFNKFITYESYSYNILFIFLSILTSLAIASISYIYIEKPLIKYLNCKFTKC